MIRSLNPATIPPETIAVVNWMLDFMSSNYDELFIIGCSPGANPNERIYTSMPITEAYYCMEQIGTFFKTSNGVYYFLSTKTARRTLWAGEVYNKNPEMFRRLQDLDVF